MTNIALQSYNQSRIHPHKFALWVAMASIMMMFAAFTSAYLVRQAAGNWLEFSLPSIFYTSTLLILVSSITMQWAYNGFVKGNEVAYKIGLIISLVLGLIFIVLQYNGWMALFNIGVDLKGNPSGSFLYVITGVHAAHVIGGIAALLVAIMHAFSLKFKPSAVRKIRFELVLQYWHFIGLLWVYLFVFLLITR